MKLHEVKLGDIVTFKNKKGKRVTGKVIYRHNGNDNAQLMGHVNVQIDDEGSYPETIHVSKLKKSLKEEFSMNNSTDHLKLLVNLIVSENNLEAQNLFKNILSAKLSETLDALKKEVAQNMFSSCDECDEEVTKEAYTDPYAAKKAAEMRKKDAEAIAAAKKEYEASKESEGKVNRKTFMKMRKEESEIVEGMTKAANKAKRSAWEIKKGRGHGDPDKRDSPSTAAKLLPSEAKRASRKWTRTEEVQQIDELDVETKRSYFLKRAKTAKAEDDRAYHNPTPANRARKQRILKGMSRAYLSVADHDIKKQNQRLGFKESSEEYGLEEGQVKRVNKAKKNSYTDSLANIDAKISGERNSPISTRRKGRKITNSIMSRNEKMSRFQVARALRKFREKGTFEQYELDEVITKSTPAGEVIRDFIKSRNPRFRGKSKSERIRMALGATYAMKRKK